MGKVRRIDFYPDEFLNGVAGMSPEQIGVYWLICSKIYSQRAGIPDDDRENARVFRVDLRTWKRVKGDLLSKGKLIAEGGTLMNARCSEELGKAHTPGNRKTICPRCSHARKPIHRKDRCLSVTVKPDGGCVFYCHNCGWAEGFRATHQSGRGVGGGPGYQSRDARSLRREVRYRGYAVGTNRDPSAAL